MQLRKVTHTLKGVRATDGAGVSLVRVLGANTTDTYDPFLMLDSFDSTDPDDYRAGFPMHPHRGIETVTFIARGAMVHEDHLGTKATVTDGEAQWLTAGSGAFHSEMPQATERLLGVGKFVVAADHDDARVECRGLTDPAEKGKSVHPRHADIRENDVRMQLACQLQRIGSVVGFLDPADGQCGRIEQFPHGDPDRRLIICNQ